MAAYNTASARLGPAFREQVVALEPGSASLISGIGACGESGAATTHASTYACTADDRFRADALDYNRRDGCV